MTARAGVSAVPAAAAPADLPGPGFEDLRSQLLEAAEALGGGPDAVSGILTGIVDDVERALAEPLEIFPVCHHSPASALAMVRRLRQRQPKVIYLELCEDLRPLLDELRNCTLPVAVQAFATELAGFPAAWGPLSVIAPITEASAEYQAIAYALDTPGVELVLVDRSTDHVFQWQPVEADPPEPPAEPAGQPEPSPAERTEPAESAALHGEAVGIEIGQLRPRFADLEAHLLRHGKVRHWSEWWDQYVEQPLAGADYDTYRQVMVLIGSLFRRLRPSAGTPDGGTPEGTATADPDRDEDRERYMWTRIREHLASSGADPAQCLYVCGAFHAASRVEQFGLESTAEFEISPRSDTKWCYGLIPSSHSAIEAQFGLAPGSVSIAGATWAKALRRGRLAPFRLAGQRGGKAGSRASAKTGAKTGAKARGGSAGTAGSPGPEISEAARLSGFLRRPPTLDDLDEAELLGWSVEIVRLARRNGYLASTADAIAVFETAILLAGMRNRARPTPYDFTDAAVTCIEKETVPGRRDVRRLCEILFGGDRVGQVGYDALPPLARDVYDRLAPLELDLTRRTIQRALLDFTAHPELRACSDVLWRLRYLLPDDAVRAIMGSRRLGETGIQESWDLAIGRNQRSLIELGYEGVTIEQVLEQRLRRKVWSREASAAEALLAVEDALCYLDSRRFAGELGERAVELLSTERTVDGAPQVLGQIRRLLAHFRATAAQLPAWSEQFVTTGYAHYCTLLPAAFSDEQAGARPVAAMLGFLFSMEGLALSLGCSRSQLELAVRQCHPQDPAKQALLWAAQHHLGELPLAELRARCDALLSNPLAVPAFPRYLSGFVQALEAVPALAPFVVEVVSRAFAQLPDRVLLPWLPRLITALRQEAAEVMPVLVREAGRTFPAALPALDSWRPPWTAPPAGAPAADLSAELVAAPAADPAGATGPVPDLLAAHPATCETLSSLLGCDLEWRTGTGSPAPGRPAGAGTGAGGHPEVATLLRRHPAAAETVTALIAG